MNVCDKWSAFFFFDLVLSYWVGLDFFCINIKNRTLTFAYPFLSYLLFFLNSLHDRHTATDRGQERFKLLFNCTFFVFHPTCSVPSCDSEVWKLLWVWAAKYIKAFLLTWSGIDCRWCKCLILPQIWLGFE